MNTHANTVPLSTMLHDYLGIPIRWDRHLTDIEGNRWGREGHPYKCRGYR